MLAGERPVLVHNAGGPDDGWNPAWGPEPEWKPGVEDDDGNRTPGNNQKQNKDFNDAIREAEGKIGKKLTPAQRRVIHENITKKGYGYHEIVDEVTHMYGSCP
ncbi:hypothetical protein [Melissospora conviva]|uniref:hypothetical protein n=1 Tax=Melissospora conviva TaxID=3388432 RepID=UPI003C1C7D3F